MPLPINPDCADLCADAILRARKERGPLFRDTLAEVIRPVIAAHEKKLMEAAIPAQAVKHTGTRKEREMLFDAVCGGCGLQRDGMTAPMKRTVAVALSTIIAVMPRLTQEEIMLRCRQYRKKHPQWDLTPNALAKHWGSLASGESLPGLLDEPDGWRGRVEEIFPESENGATGDYLAAKAWSQIGRADQDKIVRIMGELNKRQNP